LTERRKAVADGQKRIEEATERENEAKAKAIKIRLIKRQSIKEELAKKRNDERERKMGLWGKLRGIFGYGDPDVKAEDISDREIAAHSSNSDDELDLDPL